MIVDLPGCTARYGIVTVPSSDSGVRVVLVNSGVVHRIGANRMSVHLARSLAAADVASLRFDLPGIGDAPERADSLGWEASSPIEIRSAIDGLLAALGDGPVALYGNCGGAAKSFWTARVDSRVRGLFLSNPPPHPLDVGWRGTPSGTSPVVGELRDLLEDGVRVHIVFAESDEGQEYFETRLAPELGAWIDAGHVEVSVVPSCNHTFATVASKRAVCGLASAWIAALGEAREERH